MSKLLKETSIFIIAIIALLLYPKITQIVFTYFGALVIGSIISLFGGLIAFASFFISKTLTTFKLLVTLPIICLIIMAAYGYWLYQNIHNPNVTSIFLMTTYIILALVGTFLLAKIIFMLNYLLKKKENNLQ